MRSFIKPIIVGTGVLLASELILELGYKKSDLPHIQYAQDKIESTIDVYRFKEQQKQVQNTFCDAQLVTLINYEL